MESGLGSLLMVLSDRSFDPISARTSDAALDTLEAADSAAGFSSSFPPWSRLPFMMAPKSDAVLTGVDAPDSGLDRGDNRVIAECQRFLDGDSTCSRPECLHHTNESAVKVLD